jgi:hypothetical protein
MLSTKSEAEEKARDRYLTIAYKAAVVDKNHLLLNVLREKMVFFGLESMYYYNAIITYSYFLDMNDTDAEKLLYHVTFKLSTHPGTITYGDPFKNRGN